MPVLAAAWVAAAAAPCAAMTSGAHPASEAASEVDPAHAHHTMSGSDAQRPASAHARPDCPHCGPLSSDHAPDDAARHALCASADAAVAKDATAKLAKRDLVAGLPEIGPPMPSRPVLQLADGWRRSADPPASPLARHLRFCVFLN